MKTSILEATACLVLLAASGIWAQEEPVIRSRNGIRLVGDSGPRGRLEVSTRDPRFPGLSARNSSAAWLPVCDSSCTDQTAEIMCKLLGYTYGRKYYAPRVNFRSATSGYTAGFFSCSQRGAPGSRRLLAPSGGEAAEAEAVAGTDAASAAGRLPGGVDGGDAQRVRARGALGTTRFNISSPANAPYSCAFYFGGCEARGPLAAVECSHTALPPSSPPPPVPPSPPSAPQPVTDSIRLVGGAPNRGSVEPNLCPSPAAPEFCSKYGRVELQVTAPVSGGARLWAPLCAPSNETLRAEIARIACQQEYDWPSLRSSSSFTVTAAVPSEPPYSFMIPTSPATSRGDFNPSNVWVWATIDPSAATSNNPRTLQEYGITATTQPCRRGCLFAVSCSINTSK